MSGFASGFSAGSTAMTNAQRTALMERDQVLQEQVHEQTRRIRDFQLRDLEDEQRKKEAIRAAARDMAAAEAAPGAESTTGSSPAAAKSPATRAGELAGTDPVRVATPAIETPTVTPVQTPYGPPAAGAMAALGAIPPDVAATTPDAAPIVAPQAAAAAMAAPAMAAPAAPAMAAPQPAAQPLPPALAPDGRISKAERLKKVYYEHGDIAAARKEEDQIKTWKKEGVDKMLDAVIAGGDGAAAAAAFNAVGNERLGKGDQINVLRRYTHDMPGYAPIPTADIEIVRNGQREVINDVTGTRYKMHEKMLEIAKTGADYKLKQEDDRQANRRLDQQADRDAAQQAFNNRRLEVDESIRRTTAAATMMNAKSNATTAGLQADVYREQLNQLRNPQAQPTRLTVEDRSKLHGQVTDYVKELIDPREAATPEEKTALVGKRRDMTQGAMQITDLAYSAGIPVSAPESVAAYENSLDPKKVGKSADGKYLTTIVGQRVIPVKPYTAPTPTAAAAAPAVAERMVGPPVSAAGVRGPVTDANFAERRQQLQGTIRGIAEQFVNPPVIPPERPRVDLGRRLMEGR